MGISSKEEDYRARRITAYLDVLVKQQVERMKQEQFEPGTKLTRYFTLLPDSSPLRKLYLQMQQEENPVLKQELQEELRAAIVPGSIDVNIMTKLDRTNYGTDGEPLPQEFSDALSAFSGFANSTVQSSVVFSAGINMRLFGYIEQFSGFIPDNEDEPWRELYSRKGISLLL